jgi:hypothetical protein
MPDDSFSNQKNNWYVDDLWELASDMPVVRVSVNYLWEMYKDNWYWFDSNEERINYDKFLHHYKRCQEADLNYPILIFPDNKIADGVHRLVKAKLLGLDTISAVLFDHLPEANFVTENY